MKYVEIVKEIVCQNHHQFSNRFNLISNRRDRHEPLEEQNTNWAGKLKNVIRDWSRNMRIGTTRQIDHSYCSRKMNIKFTAERGRKIINLLNMTLIYWLGKSILGANPSYHKIVTL
jgi:hypothetical protein